MDKTGFNKSQYWIGIAILCAAVILGIFAYIGMNSTDGTVGAQGSALAGTENVQTSMPKSAGQEVPAAQGQPNGSAAVGSQAQQNAASNSSSAPAAKKEVVLDFLYADWCPHCQAMKPIVARIASQLPADRFAVNYYSEADANAGKEAAAMFAKYGLQSYPTFVINGNDQKVGEMPESEFLAWVCSKFSPPKPSGC